jgi:hypothetical protein
MTLLFVRGMGGHQGSAEENYQKNWHQNDKRLFSLTGVLQITFQVPGKKRDGFSTLCQIVYKQSFVVGGLPSYPLIQIQEGAATNLFLQSFQTSQSGVIKAHENLSRQPLRKYVRLRFREAHEETLLCELFSPLRFSHFAFVILSQYITSKIYRSQRRPHIIRYSGNEYAISHW